ncbi:uncharacterized protein [Excalfactoria chinensis]|uniref:uncharacterized protein n=1 Tax=Excalfactoria chinensis TaxID=46218 RepID=UPI003B3BE125
MCVSSASVCTMKHQSPIGCRIILLPAGPHCVRCQQSPERCAAPDENSEEQKPALPGTPRNSTLLSGNCLPCRCQQSPERCAAPDENSEEQKPALPGTPRNSTLLSGNCLPCSIATQRPLQRQSSTAPCCVTPTMPPDLHTASVPNISSVSRPSDSSNFPCLLFIYSISTALRPYGGPISLTGHFRNISPPDFHFLWFLAAFKDGKKEQHLCLESASFGELEYLLQL